MTNTQSQEQYEIGMVGLGVMGRNLLLDMADHKFSVAGYDKDAAKVEALRQEGKDRAGGPENAQALLAQGNSWPLPTELAHQSQTKTNPKSKLPA